MSLFVAEHKHTGETCPAKNPQLANGLLQLVNHANAKKSGIIIHGDAVADGQHHLYLILEASSKEEVQRYFAPFRMFGSLRIISASHCDQVVGRGSC
jgi:hypothetical protein